jgi:hypothetical protein
MQDTWMICYDECNAMHGLMPESCRYNWCRMHGYDLECSSKGPSWWAMERVRRFFFFFLLAWFPDTLVGLNGRWGMTTFTWPTRKDGEGLPLALANFSHFSFYFFLKIPNFCLDRSFEFSVHRECISFFVPLIFAWIAFSGFRSTGTLSIA